MQNLSEARTTFKDTVACYNKWSSQLKASAVYKLPHSNVITWIGSHHVVEYKEAPTLEKTKGFLTVPFSSEVWYLIPDDFIAIQSDISQPICITKNHVLYANSCSDPTEKKTPNNQPKVCLDSVPKNEYLQNVNNAVRKIQQKQFHKVVLARNKFVPLPDSFTTFSYFEMLCIAYPTAFVSLVNIPERGTWIGASPELLASCTQNRHFSTQSLAGTQPASANETEKNVRWGQKEIEEQAMVSRYIINCFKKIRVREFEEIGPKTIKSGQLFHLKTEYHVDISSLQFENLTSVMAQLLHPTSAVCGMPKEAALDFLNETENIHRSLYSGYLGPVRIGTTDDIYLFVNIRCAQIHTKHLEVFAGAGITEESVPESEYEETEHKMQNLTKVLDQF